jgi:prefoldin subunit 5
LNSENQAAAQAIYYQIASCERRIESLRLEIRDLQSQLDRVNDARNQVISKRLIFDSSISKERSKAADMLTAAHIRLASSYSNTMSDLLSSHDYQRASSSFDHIDDTLKTKSKQLNEEIYARERMIADLKQQVSFHRSRLASL